MSSTTFLFLKDIADFKSSDELISHINLQLESYHSFPKEYLNKRLSQLDNDKFYVFALMTDSGYPYSIFFICEPEDFVEAEQELIKFSRQYELNSIIILSAGKPNLVKYLQKNFQKGEFEYISNIEKYHQSKMLPTYGYNSGKGDELIPLSANVENLFFEAHSAIRDIDGLHSDAALDELCKFIYAKLFDEEQTKKRKYYKSQTSIYGSKIECATNFRILYKDACDYDMRVYGLRIPKYKKSRGVFDSLIKLSNAALYKIIQLFEKFSLSNSELDVKGRAFQKLYSPALRSGMGQYFTPNPVIKFMVNILSPKINDLIIDPFSGSGHFLTASLNYVISNSKDEKHNKVDEFAFHKLHGIEKSERMVRVAMTDMRLHGDGHSNIRCTDALLSFDNYEDLLENSFDIVLSNPPFGSILSKESFSGLGDFELLKGKNSLPLEVLGLERCIQFLRPNGKFGVVLPESIIINKNQNFVRNWLLSKTELLGIIGLPLETFSPYGANIKTVILFGRKLKDGEALQKDKQLFISEVESVGYDFKGTNKEFEDLSNVESKFVNFLFKTGNYES